MGKRYTEGELKVRNAVLHGAKFCLALALSGLFAAAWFGYYAPRIHAPFYFNGNWLVCGLYLVLYVLFAKLYGGFQIGISRISEIIYSQCIAQLFAGAAMYCVICLLTYAAANPLPLLGAMGVGMLVGALWAQLANRLNNRLFPPKRTAIIYDYEEAYRAIEGIHKMSWKFDVQEAVSISAGLDTVLARIEDAEAVFLCGISSSERNSILKFCVEQDIEAYIRPKIGDLLLSSARRIHLMNLPVLYCQRNQTSLWYQTFKRGLDLLIAGVALVVLSPFLALTALAVKLYDGGPVLYKQQRLTKDGRTFGILKFRSMRVDAEKDGVARLASEKDERITPVGKVIRAIRFDELPQLINILKGDMSIVGPRPERPEIAAQYEETMPEFSLRLQVKAGLTGYAQVYGKYNTSPYDKLQMDLIYIANQSMVQDIKLMLATVKVLFMRESTEGVAEGQTTAKG